MRARTNIAGLLVLAAGLIACRAIVGIDDDFDVADARKDAGSDAASADAGADAVAAQNAACQKADCRRCCKVAYPDLHDLESASTTRTCLCAPTKCGNGCGGAGGYCQGGQPSTDCVPCLDDQFTRGGCTDDCQTPGCRAGLSCLSECP